MIQANIPSARFQGNGVHTCAKSATLISTNCWNRKLKSLNGISGKLKIPTLLVEFYIDRQRMKPLSFTEFRDNGFYERGQQEQETSSKAGASPSAGWKLETGTAIITIQGQSISNANQRRSQKSRSQRW